MVSPTRRAVDFLDTGGYKADLTTAQRLGGRSLGRENTDLVGLVAPLAGRHDADFVALAQPALLDSGPAS